MFFLFLRYLNLSTDFFVVWPKANFNSFDVIYEETITIWTLCNIALSNCNQTIKCGQWREYNMRIFSFKNLGEQEAGRLVSDLFCFKKALHRVKLSGQHLSFIVLVVLDLGIQWKTIWIFRLLIQRYAKSWFLK